METVTAHRAGRREWAGLAVLALPTLLVSMDATVLHLAVPSLSAQLQPSSAALLWIVDIYGFLIAGSLITMGTLGDRIGRRRLLLIGGGAFALTSVCAAFATSTEMLIATRAALGIAGATLMPSTMSLIRNMFHEPSQRTFAIGVWVSCFSVGAAIGPLVGGWLLQLFWWGSAFLLGVPVMALLLALGPILLPESRDPNAGRLDLLSAALSLASVLLVIFGVKEAAAEGLDGTAALATGLGVVVGLLFVRRQRRLADPLVDPRLFRHRAFSASLATTTLGIVTIFGASLFVTQYLQLVVGLSPFEAGLWTVPASLASMAGSLLAPALLRGRRPVGVICGGLILAAVGFGLLSLADPASPLGVVTAYAIVSAGFGVAFTVTSDLIITVAPPERAGAASAISETGAELGGALGIAVLGSLGTAVYRGQLWSAAPAGLPPEATAAARETLASAVAAAEQLPPALGGALLEVARLAFVEGLQAVALASTLVVVGLIVLAATQLRQLEAAGSARHGAVPLPAPDAERAP